MTVRQSNNKCIYIEQLRILATFAVIVLHCYAPFFVDNAIYGTKTWWGVNILNAFTRWGVPIFLMISGMLLLDTNKEEPIKEFLKKRFSKVLIPFILWSMIYYLNTVVTNKGRVSIMEFIEKLLSKDIYYHLWFVYTLFGIYLLVPILRKLISSAKDRELWYLFGLIVFNTTIRPVISKFFHINIIMIVPIFEGYFAWFLYGYLINRLKFNPIHRIIIYVLGGVGVLCSIIGTYMLSDLTAIDDFFNGGYQFNSYLITTAIFVFFKYEISIIKNKGLKNLSISMGKLSYDVYLIHALILQKLRILLIFKKPYMEILCNSILTFILSYGIVYLFNKSTKLIGMKKNTYYKAS